jgi:hypothetical protein
MSKYTKEELNALQLESGDVFATVGGFPIGTLAKLIFIPYTDRFHFGLVWRREDDGWLIIESVGKGIAVNYLERYTNCDIEFYRVNCDKEIREKAPSKLAHFGYCGYDYILFLRLLLRVIKLYWAMIKNKELPRKLKAEDMPLDDDSQFICTEGVDIAYDQAGFRLIPEKTLAIPSAYKQVELDGRMTRLFSS